MAPIVHPDPDGRGGVRIENDLDPTRVGGQPHEGFGAMGHFVQSEVTNRVSRKKDGDILVQGDDLLVARYGDPLVQLDEEPPGGEQRPAKPKAASGGGASSAAAGTTNQARRPGEEGGEQDAGGTQNEDGGNGPKVQASRSGSGSGGTVSLSNYLQRSAGSGSSLDSGASGRMSGAFGHNFGGVRVHDDASAHSVCRSLGANAFATGSHVYFAAGRYNPGSEGGDRLLAHELTHVVQQSGGVGRMVAGKSVTLSTPGDPYEQQADHVASLVTRALHSGGNGGADVARQADDGDDAAAPAIPTMSLAEAIIQRKVSGIPDVQMDIGITLGIIGVAVSAGAWFFSISGSHRCGIDPRLNWVAERGEARNTYRRAHPWQNQTWTLFDDSWTGRLPNEYWTLTLKWRYNGAELLDITVEQNVRGDPWSSTECIVGVFDDQSETGRLGFRFNLDWDPVYFGHAQTSFSGWIGVDGAGHRDNFSWRNL